MHYFGLRGGAYPTLFCMTFRMPCSALGARLSGRIIFPNVNLLYTHLIFTFTVFLSSSPLQLLVFCITIFKHSSTVKTASTDFCLIYLLGYALKRLCAEDAEVAINRCSVVKCKHIYKPQKVAGFCLIYFQNATEAAGFFKTYSCKRKLHRKKLSGVYIKETIFGDIKASYDFSTIQTRLTPTSNSTTTSNSNSTTTGNGQSSSNPTTSTTSTTTSTTTSNSNPITSTTTTTTSNSSPTSYLTHNDEDKIDLMGDNVIRININGHLSNEVVKLRGLKQGDPLSPIFYKLAFEPFLLAILHDRQFQGYMMGVERTKLLCYADDNLVFFHDPQNLTRLQLHMSRYCAASNVKFNNDKITHLHSVEDDEPLTYLGFPLVQSRIQRVHFMGALVTKIKTAIQIHSGRSLSVVGKATVLNSLLLSKLWHILWVTPLTQADFKQLRLLAIQFLRRNTFPVISWKVWTLPKEKGGLGVIDIQVQASALHHLRNVNGYSHHQIPLLFPSARRAKGLKKQRIGTVDVLYRTVDYLPKSFDEARINTATAIVLPLQAAFYAPPSSTLLVPLRVQEMMVSDVFQYDARLNFVHWKDTRGPTLLSWKRTPCTVFKGLASGAFKFQPYFVHVCSPAPLVDSEVSFAPLVNQLRLHDGRTLGNVQASAKTFRLSVIASFEQPLTLRNVSAAHCKSFWSLSLTYIQRNVIYRFITGCIPHHSRLHYMMPAVFESSLCTVCLSCNEDASHLLFDCPSKEKVWQGVIFEFLWPTTSIADIKEALLPLDFSDIWYCQVTGISPYRILLITLSQIWLAHMRFIFDKIVIVPEAIMVNIRSTVGQIVDEDRIHSLL
ncbi:conserved hypothetical protein [Mucor ambiguus]|uniref:Reverse transcriptase domain-containing protein n=1 Tax=Mucor ambiguus TaxID=91626 RepID=A0A0C9MSG5_9FUNG|nr:conserved hypothetical protein [Mucor ambiguus]